MTSKNNKTEKNNNKEKLIGNEQWQYTKNIRFKGEPPINQDDLKSTNQGKGDFKELIQKSEKFLKEIRNFLFYPDKKSGRQKSGSKIKVNKNWLKQFFNQDFYEKTRYSRKDNQGKYAIKDVEFFEEKMNQWLRNWEGNIKVLFSACRNEELWLDYWEGNIKELKKLLKQPEHSQQRRSDIAFCIQKLCSQRNLSLMKTFFKEIKDKNTEKDINSLSSSFEEIEGILLALEQEYLPTQGAGILVAKGSMNYYTVNKKSKYYDKDLKKLKDKRDNPYTTITQENSHYEWKQHNKTIFTFQSEQEKE